MSIVKSSLPLSEDRKSILFKGKTILDSPHIGRKSHFIENQENESDVCDK